MPKVPSNNDDEVNSWSLNFVGNAIAAASSCRTEGTFESYLIRTANENKYTFTITETAADGSCFYEAVLLSLGN